MIPEEDDLITGYIREELTEPEKALFLQRLQDDSVFKEKYQAALQLFESLGTDSWSRISAKKTAEVEKYKALFASEDTAALKAVIKQANAAYQNDNLPQTKKRTSYKWLSAVAAILLLFVSINYFKNNNSNQSLYDSSISATDLPSITSRGASKNALQDIKKQYDAGKYKTVLETLEAKPLDNTFSYVYKGLAALQMGKYSLAIQTFDALIASDLLDAEKGYWYKALVYLKQDKNKEAKQVLEKISSNNWYNAALAKELLKKID